jgi:hypothetical protein
MKAKQIYEGTQALRSIANEKLPIKGAYAISRLLAKLELEFKHLEETRVALVKKWGTLDELGNYSIPKEDIDTINSFLTEFGDFLDTTEVEFEFNQLDLNQLGTLETTSNLIPVLLPFIKE